MSLSRYEDARDRMIVALDVADTDKAEALVKTLGDAVSFYKIGMELVYGGGLLFARDLAASGKRVFLDLKLHDIPNTVKKAAAQVSRLGMSYLTVHAFPQTMKAALEATQGTGTKILGVTVMTSSPGAPEHCAVKPRRVNTSRHVGAGLSIPRMRLHRATRMMTGCRAGTARC